MKEVTDPQILEQLNSPQGSGEYREVTDPQILAQLNGQNVPHRTSDESDKSQFGGKFGDVAMHVLGGAATVGRDVLNTPARIGAKNLLGLFGKAAMPGFNSAITDTLIGDKKFPKLDESVDYYKGLGVKENLADKFGVGLAEFSPFMRGAGALTNGMKMAPYIENALSGSGFSAAKSDEENKLPDAMSGALWSVPASILGHGGTALTNYAAKKYAQSAIPEFMKAATEKIKSLLPVSDYANQLFSKFSKTAAENKGNWDTLQNTASQIDNNLGKGFNNQPYHDYIDSHISNVKKLDPAQQEQYAQSLTLAKKAKEIAPESFTGMVAARQNINSVLKDFLDPTGMTKPNRYSQDFITGLKNNLKNETLEANAGKLDSSALNDFKSQWETANQSHQSLQDFYKSMQSTTGVVEPIKPTRKMYEAANQTGTLDPSILNKYAPPLTAKGSQGVEGLNQLEKLFGNSQTAQDAAKAALFRRPTEQGASTIDSAKIYSDMSPAQRQAIFGNSHEGQMLDAINKTRLAFGKEPERTIKGALAHHVIAMSPIAALGFGGGLASGESMDKAALTGLSLGLGSRALAWGAGKTATPSSVATAIRLGKASPFTGRYLNPFIQNFNPAIRRDQ